VQALEFFGGVAQTLVVQRYQTTASARFRASQFHDFDDRSADLHGGRQRAPKRNLSLKRSQPESRRLIDDFGRQTEINELGPLEFA
jgi:hypothetical protein